MDLDFCTALTFMDMLRDRGRSEGGERGLGGMDVKRTGEHTIDKRARWKAEILDKREDTKHCKNWKILLTSWTWYHVSESVLVGLL